ncbi:MAG: methyltransferase domain-containing protein [Burkholderiaceae bacterium]|nr:methyltransferase domain-containing protein [Burkholderiaceae bacterium]
MPPAITTDSSGADWVSGANVAFPASCETVRRQFDRRAGRFADGAVLVREVARRLCERLDVIRVDARTVLDLGCGAGWQRHALSRRFAGSVWLGVDLSLGMLAQQEDGAPTLARWLPAALRPRARQLRICADAERMPFQAGSVDFVFSNLMLNWHPAPHRVLAEIARVLSEGAPLLFSAYGPDTLLELRAACAAALPQSRPVPFVDLHDLGDMMAGAGFAEPVTDAEKIRLTYASPRELLADVRALGGNPRDDRLRTLPSGRQARNLLAELESRRGADGRIGLTFEITYGIGWKAPPRAPAGAPITISVESLRNQLRRR